MTLLAAFLSIFILGCGEDSPPRNDFESIIIETQNSFDSSSTASRSIIDLSKSIKSKSNVNLQLAKIVPLSRYNQCNVLDVVGLTYTVETNTPQICRFEYTVVPSNENINGKGWGVSEVAVSDGDIEKLPPYGRALIQGTTTNISLILPEGALLDPDSLELRGTTYSEFEGDNLGEVSAEGNIIRYTAPITTYGQVQIYYTAVNDITGTLYSGVVYVAISLDANGNPTAELNRQLDSISLVETTSLTIDVEDFVYDIDGDKLQLVDVYTHGTGWARIDPMSTSFVFTPTKTGTHHIAYVVSDRRGGYAIGTVFFNARKYDSIYDAVQEKTFTPTFDAKDIESVSGIYTETFLETGSFGFEGFYPTFSPSLAENYCTIRGLLLPSVDELKRLYENPLGSDSAWESKYKWPTGVPYVGVDGYFSLNDGSSSALGEYNAGFVSCIYDDTDPSSYYFESRYLSAGWGNNVMITALRKFGENDLAQLPADRFELEATVISTVPAGLNDSVTTETKENTVMINNPANNVRSAIIDVTDPSVKGTPDTVRIYVGVVECPSDVSVVETQVLGCVPVIYNRDDDIAFSAAMSNRILDRIGFDMSTEKPLFIRESGTSPNYMYSNGYIFDETPESFQSNAINKKFYGQLCEIFNFNIIGGRTNWTAMLDDDILHTDYTSETHWNGNLAQELTNWMSKATGLATRWVGQGYLLNFNGPYLRQVNQYQARNYGQIQGGYAPAETGGGASNSEVEWQYVTCVSPNNG